MHQTLSLALVLLLAKLLQQLGDRYFWVRPTTWQTPSSGARTVWPPIDVVYAWSGEDPSTDRRQRSSGELQFSLRSLWKYARWVRRVHLLVDTGKNAPSWVRSPDASAWINMVDRCPLFNNRSHCPTRNGNVVYSVAHLVPGLSNLFLLMDDDTFFSHPITPDFFFDAALRPIVRTSHAAMPVYPEGTPLPQGLVVPPAKWTMYHHRVSPARVDLVTEFTATFTDAVEFARSHTSGRFPPGTSGAEEMPMWW
jgi:hypothetical protein